MTRRSEVGIDMVARDMASREIDRVGGSLDSLGGRSQSTGRHFGALGGIVSNVATGVFMGVGMQAFNMVSGALSSIPGTVINMNAALEKSTLQFQTLFGGGAAAADRAKEHVAALFDFAKKTPFETQPIIQASRTMQTFGGDALNSMKNLEMFGDAAAGASVDINEVAFWSSRAYAAIQGGQPFGEARMRLQELALITPQAAAEMEKMQKEGKSAGEIWAVMEGQLGKFTGAMDLQAGTWEGLMSTLSDTVGLTFAQAFEPFFQKAKDGVSGLIAIFGSEGFQKTLYDVSETAMDVFGAITDVLGTIWTLAQPGIEALMSAFEEIVEALQPVLDTIGPAFEQITGMFDAFSGKAGEAGAAFNDFGAVVETVVPTLLDTILGFITTMLTELGPRVQELGYQMINWVLDALPGLVANLGTFAQSIFDWIINSGVPQLAAAVGPLVDTMVDWVVNDALPKLGNVLPKIAGTILDFITKNVPVLIGKLAEWAAAFVGWLLPRLPKILGALAEFVGKMAGWVISEGVPKVLKMAGDLAIALVNGFLKFVIGPPGLFEKIATFITTVLIPGILKFGPILLKTAGDIAGNFVKGFIDFMGSLPGKVADVIRKAFQGLDIKIGPFHISAKGIEIDLPKIDLPGLATGAWRIPQDMVAMIHQGEMVIPEDIAARLRGETGARGIAPSPSQTRDLVAPVMPGTGGGVVINLTQHFGAGSVRSDDDIRRLGIEMQERAQLLGFSATVRQIGRATV